MTQLPSDKFNVAWFKLAEFVTRKEKERALHIYRLLVHSLPDEAFAQQLEGDLLWSFNDPKAIECYVKAATTYEKREDFMQAVAVYEHILALKPQSSNYLLKAVRLYERLGDQEKMAFIAQEYIQWCIDKSLVQDCYDFVLNLTISPHHKNKLYEQALIGLFTKNIAANLLLEILYPLLDNVIDQPELSPLLTKLASVGDSLHKHALDYIQNHKK